MLAIKNNLMAENAARHLGTSYNALARSVERLSSGLRINSAKDDAAGLAVRELIRADVATLRQGVRNAQDGISMVQTAEGALGAVNAILVRLKELSEQAATGSYSDPQRVLMNQEFAELAKEITRIAETTDFNDIALLNSQLTYEIHLGSTAASSETKVTITGELMDAGTLSLSATKQFAVHTGAAATLDVNWIEVTTNGDLVLEFADDTDADDVAIGALTMGLTTTGSGGDADYSMQEIIDLINAKSVAAQTGYNMATAVYLAGSNQYQLKLSTYKTGAGLTTALATAASDVVTTATKLETAGNYTGTAGSGTGASIDTQAAAILALDVVDAAISTKDTYRAKLGYMMNRLEAASQVVTIQAENLLTAESRISDVDVATEMANMTRNQVLAQAGVSMLAQANMMPQMALKLLG